MRCRGDFVTVLKNYQSFVQVQVLQLELELELVQSTAANLGMVDELDVRVSVAEIRYRYP
jgi:hypothetical protein